MISRERYGTLGEGGDCWPQMAGMIPDLHDEVLLVLIYTFEFEVALLEANMQSYQLFAELL